MTATETLVRTPFGTLRAWSTGPNHVGFSTKGNINVEPVEGEADNFIVINRVEYTLRVDLHRAGTTERVWRELNGAWVLESWQSVMAQTPWTKGGKYLSAAAGAKVYGVLLPFLVEWLNTEEARTMIEVGTSARLHSDYVTAQRKIDQLSKDLADAELELSLIRRQIEKTESEQV